MWVEGQSKIKKNQLTSFRKGEDLEEYYNYIS